MAMFDVDARVKSLELSNAVNDERWRKVEDDLSEIRTGIKELLDSSISMKISMAVRDGRGSGYGSIINWIVLFSTAAATVMLTVLEFAKH
jgi:hypothetical protein